MRAAQRFITENLAALNQLEPHLGCVRCLRPLDDGVCSTCQGDS